VNEISIIFDQSLDKWRKPDWVFAEPEVPDQGGEQLPFVMCRFYITLLY